MEPENTSHEEPNTTPQAESEDKDTIAEQKSSVATIHQSADHAATVVALEGASSSVGVEQRFAIEKAAVDGDWSQDRIDVALAQAAVSKSPVSAAGEQLLGDLAVGHKEAADDVGMEDASLALNNERDRQLAEKEVAINEAAARGDWSQDRIDSVKAANK